MLVNLPTEIKQLVNRGIYSLYSLSKQEGSAEFVLVTDERKTFFLDRDGKLLQAARALEKLEVSKSIKFPEISTGELFKVNAG